MIALLALLIANPLHAETHRPFSEMKGDCENFQMNLHEEFKLWAKSPHGVRAATTTEADSAPAISLALRTDLQLSPSPKVRWIIPPEKAFSPEEPRWAGLARFPVAEAGTYRVALGAKVWLDVIDAQTRQAVAAESFEMQTRCDTIFKVVEFRLKPQAYWVQLSSSPGAKVQLLVTRAP